MATLANIMDRFTAARAVTADTPRMRALDNEDPFVIPRFPNEDVYLYVKRIDNSRVVREADPAARKVCWKMIASSFAFAALVIGLLLPSVDSLMAGYKLEALRGERQRLELDRSALELQETKLLSPARLEELARMQRFVDPAPEAVVYLDSKLDRPILARK